MSAAPPPDRIGWRRELGATLRLAGPLAGTEVAYMVMSITDTLMMGRIGTESLAAGGLASTVTYTMICAALGLLQSIQPIVAHGSGAGDRRAFARTLAAGLILGLACSVPIVLVLASIDRLLGAIGEPLGIARLAWVYAGAFAWAVPAWLCGEVFGNYMTALGRTHFIMAVAVLSCVVNLILNWALIYGHLGLPALGLAGSGYATAIVGWAMLAAVALYAWRGRLLPSGLVRIGLADLYRGIRELLTLGLPIAGQWVIEMGMFSCSALLMGRFGPVALATHQICLNLCTLAYVVPHAIANAASVRVGFHIGAGMPKAARTAGFTALALGVSFMAAAAVCLVLFSRPIFSLYLDAGDPSLPDVETLGAAMLTLAALFEVFDGTQCVASGALRGLKDVRFPLVAVIIGYWVLGLPIGAGLAFGAGIGPIGLWWGFASALIVLAFLLTLRFRRRVDEMIAQHGKILSDAA